MEYKINVPEDCELIVTREGQMAIIEVVPKEPEFKENDIVTCETEGIECIAIFKDKIDAFSFRAKALYTTVISQSDWCSYGERCRFATDSEKQLLFDKLKEKCLMFDGENIVRWRAEIGGHYYFINYNMNVEKTFDCNHEIDSCSCKIGNYFPTREMAEEFQKQYIDLLNNFHKNL